MAPRASLINYDCYLVNLVVSFCPFKIVSLGPPELSLITLNLKSLRTPDLDIVSIISRIFPKYSTLMALYHTKSSLLNEVYPEQNNG